MTSVRVDPLTSQTGCGYIANVLPGALSASVVPCSICAHSPTVGIPHLTSISLLCLRGKPVGHSHQWVVGDG
jgi:hypothetical protein